MSLSIAFSAGEVSCSQPSVRPSRSYAVFIYCHSVVFTVACCHSFGAGESLCSQSSSCLAASWLSTSSRPSWYHRLSSSSCPVWHLHCCLPHARHGIVIVVFLMPVVASSLVVFLMPRVASPLSSSSRLSWHHRLSTSSCPVWRTRRSSVPLTAAVSVRGGVPFCPAQPSVCAVVFRSASAWHTR